MAGSAWFVFTAKQVTILVEPEPEKIEIAGGLAAPRLGSHFLMRPGEYSLIARKTCYRELRHRFRVGPAEKQQLQLIMEKMPGKLTINAHPEDLPGRPLENALIRIDGKEIGRTPLPTFEVDAGVRRLQISAPNYKDLQRDISVDGCGKLQTVDAALIPGWSDVTIGSRPSGATVEIDGQAVGKTPARLQLAEGPHEVTLKAAGYKTWRRKLDIAAGRPLSLEDIELQPADGRLTVTTVPPAADVTIDTRAVGRSPLNLDLPPNKKYTIVVTKRGFEAATRAIQLESDESKTVSIELKPRTGTVHLDITPQDAELWIDGVKQEASPRRLELEAVEHRLEIKKAGYETYRQSVLPRPGDPIELKVVLQSIERIGTSTSSRISAPNGYSLVLVSPGAFTMGSSRREQGRRSNEALRPVELTRPFYMGMREVTNAEFRQFQADHRAGRQGTQPLDDDSLPVVEVSWEQAALFCNWLSAKASLPPVYVEKNGRLTAADQIGTGYRLPTEAEWEYAARIGGGQAAAGLKFPWGSGYPPPRGSGNYADASAKDILPAYIESYDDGYPATAPPGKFKANRLGLHDMGGNVAEWCHDYYQIYDAGKKSVDPAGPREGRHHVVRGSSWQHGNISALRLAYRDYSDGKRPDLGFRIARYAQ